MASIDELITELRGLLGEAAVSTDLRTRERASVDDATMSPVLAARLPLPPADLVVLPLTPQDAAAAVAAAVRHGVPVTPRGKGTGNYGQAIPLERGMVLDLTRMRTVDPVPPGSTTITADAGARMIVLEQTANLAGRELWMFPSTVRSTLGGFLAGGSGGTGSIEFGDLEDGFVTALEVVHADTEQPTIVRVTGAQVLPYLHAYGVTGIIVRATVCTSARHDWQSVYASFADFRDAQAVLRRLPALDPVPRLGSADMAALTETFPRDEAIRRGSASLRAVLRGPAVAAATDLIVEHGGRVEAVRAGLQAGVAAAMLSYNHPSWWLLKARPGIWFHLEVGGDALIDRFEEVLEVFPATLMHLEANTPQPHGMLTAHYESPEAIEAGIVRLAELGVGAHSPHHWELDRRVEEVRAAALTRDPAGLLNPRKLPAVVRPGD